MDSILDLLSSILDLRFSILDLHCPDADAVIGFVLRDLAID
jgi:hypothetical protein